MSAMYILCRTWGGRWRQTSLNISGHLSLQEIPMDAFTYLRVGQQAWKGSKPTRPRQSQGIVNIQGRVTGCVPTPFRLKSFCTVNSCSLDMGQWHRGAHGASQGAAPAVGAPCSAWQVSGHSPAACASLEPPLTSAPKRRADLWGEGNRLLL